MGYLGDGQVVLLVQVVGELFLGDGGFGRGGVVHFVVFLWERWVGGWVGGWVRRLRTLQKDENGSGWVGG